MRCNTASSSASLFASFLLELADDWINVVDRLVHGTILFKAGAGLRGIFIWCVCNKHVITQWVIVWHHQQLYSVVHDRPGRSVTTRPRLDIMSQLSEHLLYLYDAKNVSQQTCCVYFSIFQLPICCCVVRSDWLERLGPDLCTNQKASRVKF